MKLNKKNIFNQHLDEVEKEKTYAPKGFLQPLYDLVGSKVCIHSNTTAGRRGIEIWLDSVSQGFDAQLGRTAITLKFSTGSNLTLPIPSSIEPLVNGGVYLSFEKRDPFADSANPYRQMRRNVKGYTINKDGGFAEVKIEVLEKPKDV